MTKEGKRIGGDEMGWDGMGWDGMGEITYMTVT